MSAADQTPPNDETKIDAVAATGEGQEGAADQTQQQSGAAPVLSENANTGGPAAELEGAEVAPSVDDGFGVTTAAASAPAVVDQGTQDKSAAPEPAPTPAPAPEPAAAQAPAQAPAVQVQSTTAGNTGDSVLDVLIKRAEGNPAQQALVNGLRNYTTAMAKGVPMSPTKGIEHQYTLWAILKGVVEANQTYEEFRAQWNIVLAYFHHYNNGCLGGRYVFRFADTWARGSEQLGYFQKLLNLIHVTSDPTTRQEFAGKKVDVKRTMEEGFSPEAAGRVLQYYNQ